MTGASAALRGSGFVWIRSALPSAAAAFAKAQELVSECAALDGHDELSVIGNFILPPPGGPPTRDFQTLHFDFGIPLRPLRDQDVARYTALFIPHSAVGVTAMTRLVPLRASSWSTTLARPGDASQQHRGVRQLARGVGRCGRLLRG